MASNYAPTPAEILQKSQEEGSLASFGRYQIDCLWYSPYPDEYLSVEMLYVCHHCFRYMKDKQSLFGHLVKYHPHRECLKQDTLPEVEVGHYIVYEAGNIKIKCVDSKVDKLYCQNLSLFGKLFIDHKTLFYDIARFLYYVLIVEDEIVGYFSKERDSPESHNLSCIIVFPQHQKKGYGQVMIEFSYALSRIEERPGTPERPLSEQGRAAYMNYWSVTLLRAIHERLGTTRRTKKDLTIDLKEIASEQFMMLSDIEMAVDTLGWTKLKSEALLNLTESAWKEKFSAFQKAIERPALDHEKVKLPSHIVSPVESYATYNSTIPEAQGNQKKRKYHSTPNSIKHEEIQIGRKKIIPRKSLVISWKLPQ